MRLPAADAGGDADADAKERHPLAFSLGSDDESDAGGDDTPSAGPPPQMRRARSTSRLSVARALHRASRVALRVFPRVVLLVAVAAVVLAALPGGWRVALCAADLLPPPRWDAGGGAAAGWPGNVSLIGHRGSEWPYPENSLAALVAGARATKFIELDVALTKDGEVIVLHDLTFNRTSNGTGLACMHSAAYARSLELDVPDRDPSGRLARGKPCSRRVGAATVPCTYTVPTLADVFDAAPDDTRFMLDVKECFTPGVSVDSPICSNCTRLMQRTRQLMKKGFVRPERVVFTSTQAAALRVFWKGMPRGSSFALSVDARFTHYKRASFLALLDGGFIDGVAMYVGLAAVRPDLVRAALDSMTPDKRKQLDVYAWTVRTELNFRLARCAGVRNLIVAEPQRLARQLVKRLTVASDGGGTILG